MAVYHVVDVSEMCPPLRDLLVTRQARFASGKKRKTIDSMEDSGEINRIRRAAAARRFAAEFLVRDAEQYDEIAWQLLEAAAGEETTITVRDGIAYGERGLRKMKAWFFDLTVLMTEDKRITISW